jgi:DNA polymerase (family 10)
VLATIRGDSAEELLLTRAIDLVRARHFVSDAELAPLFETPPADVDPGVLKRLRQMYEAGGWVLVESAIADLPADLRWLFESGTVTLEQLGTLHRTLGVTTVADLAAAVREQAVRRLTGFDAAIEAAIAGALPSLRDAVPRVPLGRAVAIAEPLLADLRALAGVRWALPTGSLRRGQDLVGDIELVVSMSHPEEAIARLLQSPDVTRCLHLSPRRVYLLMERVQVGIRFPEPENAGASLLYLTGSAAHFDALRAHAAKAGWRLETAGLHTAESAFRASPSEDEIYAALGLPCIPPEIRDGEDEIGAAVRGELPALVSWGDIRGDLHMHTSWSDGRDSIEDMVQSCRALGYEYLAITDHSPHSAATRTLTTDSVNRQADEIAALRERQPEIAILHGCEVDILPDGHLDFPDRVLERFDIVLASLHEHAGQSSEQLMRRYVGAMRHPLVTMITHPTNRLVPYRPGYDLDYARLFDLAAETRTVVEIDGAPAHLDLDGRLARQAIGAGAIVAIDSDCHRAEMLDRQMQLGIVTARRGWVEPRHVLNTRSIDEVRAEIAAKRAGSV